MTRTVSQALGKGKLRPLKTDPSFWIYREARVTIDDDDLDVIVEISFRNESGVPECVELVLTAREDGPPINADRARVPVAELVEVAAHAMVLKASGEDPLGPLEPVSERNEARAFVAARDAERRNARRRITDEELRTVADVYRRAVASGRSTTVALQVELGLTPDQARQRVVKARRAGYLEPAK